MEYFVEKYEVLRIYCTEDTLVKRHCMWVKLCQECSALLGACLETSKALKVTSSGLHTASVSCRQSVRGLCEFILWDLANDDVNLGLQILQAVESHPLDGSLDTFKEPIFTRGQIWALGRLKKASCARVLQDVGDDVSMMPGCIVMVQNKICSATTMSSPGLPAKPEVPPASSDGLTKVLKHSKVNRSSHTLTTGNEFSEHHTTNIPKRGLALFSAQTFHDTPSALWAQPCYIAV